MITAEYHIAFNFQIENTRFLLPMSADVEVHHSQAYYVVKNLNTGSRKPILPDITIRKKDGHWVHQDSEKESYLSIRGGQAIDALQGQSEQPASNGYEKS